MSIAIAGLGWVTPLGAGLEEVWAQLRKGVIPETKAFSHPLSGRALPYFVVPPATLAQLQRNPRLRRSSTISYLGVAAGLAALEHAGVPQTSELAERTAVIFAITDGGVAYTRRFYEQIVKARRECSEPAALSRDRLQCAGESSRRAARDRWCELHTRRRRFGWIGRLALRRRAACHRGSGSSRGRRRGGDRLDSLRRVSRMAPRAHTTRGRCGRGRPSARRELAAPDASRCDRSSEDAMRRPRCLA